MIGKREKGESGGGYVNISREMTWKQKPFEKERYGKEKSSVTRKIKQEYRSQRNVNFTIQGSGKGKREGKLGGEGKKGGVGKGKRGVHLGVEEGGVRDEKTIQGITWRGESVYRSPS